MYLEHCCFWLGHFGYPSSIALSWLVMLPLHGSFGWFGYDLFVTNEVTLALQWLVTSATIRTPVRTLAVLRRAF